MISREKVYNELTKNKDFYDIYNENFKYMFRVPFIDQLNNIKKDVDFVNQRYTVDFLLDYILQFNKNDKDISELFIGTAINNIVYFYYITAIMRVVIESAQKGLYIYKKDNVRLIPVYVNKVPFVSATLINSYPGELVYYLTLEYHTHIIKLGFSTWGYGSNSTTLGFYTPLKNVTMTLDNKHFHIINNWRISDFTIDKFNDIISDYLDQVNAKIGGTL